jgi:hypothetical protein
VLPIEARGDETFNIVAVWAKPPYASTVYRALGDYTPFLNGAQSVVLGDFNSNAAFEPWRGVNHLTVDGVLNAMGLTSAYHSFFDEPQGEETRGRTTSCVSRIGLSTSTIAICRPSGSPGSET